MAHESGRRAGSSKFDLKKFIIGVIIFLVATLVAIFLWPTVNPFAPASSAVSPDQVEEQKVRRKIDGVMVNADVSDLKLYALMIENHPDARPQSGLNKAKLVWEAPVEGGITRFMAVYDGTEGVSEIGPVRSARPYYLDWVKELDAAYGHVGGSPEALTLISTYKILDFNQFFNDKYYWRSSRRLAPHNVYTSSELLARLKKDRKLSLSQDDSWLFKDDVALSARPTIVNDLAIEYSTDLFEVTWKYDVANNEYVRYMGGEKHKDIDGSEIKAKNIAVQFASVSILDDEGRRRIKTIETGRALVVQDGQVIDGNWKKTSQTSRTRFYDASGQEISFNAGVTWIEVVPKGTDVSY